MQIMRVHLHISQAWIRAMHAGVGVHVIILLPPYLGILLMNVKEFPRTDE